MLPGSMQWPGLGGMVALGLPIKVVCDTLGSGGATQLCPPCVRDWKCL